MGVPPVEHDDVEVRELDRRVAVDVRTAPDRDELLAVGVGVGQRAEHELVVGVVADHERGARRPRRGDRRRGLDAERRVVAVRPDRLVGLRVVGERRDQPLRRTRVDPLHAVPVEEELSLERVLVGLLQRLLEPGLPVLVGPAFGLVAANLGRREARVQRLRLDVPRRGDAVRVALRRSREGDAGSRASRARRTSATRSARSGRRPRPRRCRRPTAIAGSAHARRRSSSRRRRARACTRRAGTSPRTASRRPGPAPRSRTSKRGARRSRRRGTPRPRARGSPPRGPRARLGAAGRWRRGRRRARGSPGGAVSSHTATREGGAAPTSRIQSRYGERTRLNVYTVAPAARMHSATSVTAQRAVERRTAHEDRVPRRGREVGRHRRRRAGEQHVRHEEERREPERRGADRARRRTNALRVGSDAHRATAALTPSASTPTSRCDDSASAVARAATREAPGAPVHGPGRGSPRADREEREREQSGVEPALDERHPERGRADHEQAGGERGHPAPRQGPHERVGRDDRSDHTARGDQVHRVRRSTAP